MKKPSIKGLRAANPEFFDPSLGDFGVITEHAIEREGDSWMFKVLTKHGTRPVYRVGQDMSLDYERHGW